MNVHAPARRTPNIAEVWGLTAATARLPGDRGRLGAAGSLERARGSLLGALLLVVAEFTTLFTVTSDDSAPIRTDQRPGRIIPTRCS